MSIFISQAYGKGDEREGNYYFHTILKIAIIVSVVIGIITAVLAEPIMKICNHQDDTLDLSVSFFRIIMGFMFFQAVSTVLNVSLRGIGKTKVTLVSNVAMGITDILFNYLLIEGRLGFPRLEIRGDAIATVLGSISACIISIIVICSQNDFIHLKGFFTENGFSDRERLRIIFNKAGNIVFENLFIRIGFLVSSVIVSMLSSGKTAVYAVAMILLNYSFAFGDGIQSAVVALTGRAYGAGDYKAFRHYFRIALAFGVLCSVMLGIIYITSSEVYYKAFFTDREAIDDGSRYSVYAALLTLLQIIRRISRYYLEHAYSLNLSAAAVLKTDNLGNDIFNLYTKLNNIKAASDISDPLGTLPVVMRERHTGEPVVLFDKDGGDYISRSSVIRRKEAKKRKELFDIKDIRTTRIGGKADYLAYIHADGNNLGITIGGILQKTPDYIQGIIARRMINRNIENAYRVHFIRYRWKLTENSLHNSSGISNNSSIGGFTAAYTI